MANNNNVQNQINLMLYEMFLLETGMQRCVWVEQRLAAGDRESVRVFLRRINRYLPAAEEVRLVTRILRDPAITSGNHTRFK